MKTHMNPILILAALLFFQCQKTKEQPVEEQPVELISKITIDATKQVSKVPAHSGGVVADWLTDSDLERPRKKSFVSAMKEMGVKFIRFPYGHLADNYLWDADGDWGNKLTPKVATFSQSPAGWNWAVNPSTGEFLKDMDFDEYISICKAVGAEPMVVVNILSYKYKDGPSYQQLKESAVEWVKYANVTKKYGVKRWALGNEVDHHKDLIPLDEYKELYSDFAAAMKKVDPSIWVGPGLLGNWHAEMLQHDPENIGFICVHNYLYNYSWRNNDYEGWKNATDILVNNVEKCQNTVRNSSIPQAEIHVTEMNSRPWSNNSDAGDLFRALAYGEMLLNAINFENVKATYVWDTHSPWVGENEVAPYDVLDQNNDRTPRGEVIKIVNDNLLDYWVSVPRINGFIRTYACIDETKKKLNIFLINKDDHPSEITIQTPGFLPGSDSLMDVFTGNDPLDISPSFSSSKSDVTRVTEGLKVKLKPLSLSVIHLRN